MCTLHIITIIEWVG